MDPHLANKLIVTKYCFLIHRDDTSFVFFLSLFFVFVLCYFYLFSYYRFFAKLNYYYYYYFNIIFFIKVNLFFCIFCDVPECSGFIDGGPKSLGQF